jgi:hypothetical protein
VTTDLRRTGTYRGEFTATFPVKIDWSNPDGSKESCQNVETRAGSALLSLLVRTDSTVPLARLFVNYTSRTFGQLTCASGATYPPGVWFWDLNYGGFVGDFSSPSTSLAHSGVFSTSKVVQNVSFSGLLLDAVNGQFVVPFVRGEVKESLTMKDPVSTGTSSFTTQVTLTRQPD